MSSNKQSLSNNPIVPLERVSLSSSLTNLVLDSDIGHSSLLVNTGTTTSLYIDKFANIGINNKNPETQLDISSNNGSCLRLRFNNSPTAYANMFMASNGNLSINPNTPNSSITTSASLSVAGSVSISSTEDAVSSVNGGSLTVGGGVAVGKSLHIGTDLFIGGDLYVNGTTTTINSSSITVQDNTLLLNASPSGINQSGLLINRFQFENDNDSGSVITDIPSLTTTVLSSNLATVRLSTGSIIDNFYQGWWIKTGSQTRRIESYVGSTRTITLSTAFTTIPNVGATIQLFNRSFAMFVWDETNKNFTAAFASRDSTSNITITDRANLNVGQITAASINTSQFSISSINNSTSPTTGSLVVSGGLGVARSLHVGDGIHGIIRTADQPNITSLGSLTSLALLNTNASQFISQSLTSNQFSLVIGVNGTTRATNPGLAFIRYNASDCILFNSSGEIGIGTNTFGYKINIGGTVNASNYFLNGNLLNLTNLSYFESVVPGTATAEKAVITNSANSVSGFNSIGSTSFVFGTTTLTQTEASYLTGITTGTAFANKALVLNADKNISGINTLSTDNLFVNGNDIIDLIASNEFLSGVVAGSASANKALIVNGDTSIAGINSLGVNSININGSIIGSEAAFLSGVVAGTAANSKALVLNHLGNVSGIFNLGTTNLILGGETLGFVEASYLSMNTAGTAIAGKALVLDNDRNISGIGLVRSDILHFNTHLRCIDGETTHNITPSQFRTLNVATNGVGQANRVVVLDSSRNISNVNQITTTGRIIMIPTDGFGLAHRHSSDPTSPEVVISTNDTQCFLSSFRNHDLILQTNAQNRLTITNAGIVGIGKTPNAAYQLDVNGAINSSEYLVNGTPILTTLPPPLSDLLTDGVGVASKALVLSADRNLSNINSLTVSTLIIGSTEFNASAFDALSMISAGVGSANKALILNSSRDISNINNLSLTGTFYNANPTANGQYVGTWGPEARPLYWGIGYDGQSDRIRLGMCSDVFGTWNETYATVIANNFVSISDYRLKDNVKTISYGLDDVLKLKPVSYIMKSTGKEELGFLAHEVGEHVPEVVYGEKDKVENNKEEYQSINYVGLVPVLIKAIQEQNEIIEKLKERLCALEKTTT